MRALCWNGANDLHLIDGYLPTMRPGDIIGHEFTGEVAEAGAAVRKVRRGDRLVVPSFISCGGCWYCERDLLSLVRQRPPSA